MEWCRFNVILTTILSNIYLIVLRRRNVINCFNLLSINLIRIPHLKEQEIADNKMESNVKCKTYIRLTYILNPFRITRSR